MRAPHICSPAGTATSSRDGSALVKNLLFPSYTAAGSLAFHTSDNNNKPEAADAKGGNHVDESMLTHTGAGSLNQSAASDGGGGHDASMVDSSTAADSGALSPLPGFYPTNGSLRLTRFEGPNVFTWNILKTLDSEAYRPGEWNRLRVRIDGEGRIICSVNDQMVIDIVDFTFKAGRIGLCKFRAPSAEFRKFRHSKRFPKSAKRGMPHFCLIV